MWRAEQHHVPIVATLMIVTAVAFWLQSSDQRPAFSPSPPPAPTGSGTLQTASPPILASSPVTTTSSATGGNSSSKHAVTSGRDVKSSSSFPSKLMDGDDVGGGEASAKATGNGDVINATAASADELTAADAAIRPLFEIGVQGLNVFHEPFPTVGGDGDPIALRVSKSRYEHSPADPYSRRCPPSSLKLHSRRPDDKKLMTAIAKYTNYVRQYCNASGMLQMHVTFPIYLSIIDKMAALVGLKPNQRVLDFGAGCGTTLNYLYKRFNTTGTGIDLTLAAVDHATRHAQPNQLFCHGEGTRFLLGLPDNYFDHVLSWSVVHHIRRKQAQCAAVAQLVRVVKPGGYVFVGHMRGEHTLDFWIKKRRCAIAGTAMRILTDYRVFGVEGFKRNKYPSVLIQKLLNATVNPGAINNISTIEEGVTTASAASGGDGKAANAGPSSNGD